MSKFKFRLATLLRLRESVRDERRQQLAQAYQAEALLRQQEQQVQAEWERLEERVRTAGGPGAVNVDALLEAQRFAFVLRANKQQIAAQKELVLQEIERRRQALVEANRDVQVLERLRQRQHERFRNEEERRDIRRLDEAAQMRVLEEVE